MSGEIPAEFIRRAGAMAAGQWAAPVAQPAATVVLLRPAASGVELLLLARPATMLFAPGMHVFPGGRVEPAHDVLADRELAGSLPQVPSTWAPDPGLARAILVAVVREAFEEAGVLLAVDASGQVPVGGDPRWDQDRAAVTADAARFGEVLARRGLRVAAGLLAPIAHWVTPEVESRRFDTRFFAALMPAGQSATLLGSESDLAIWVSPQGALEQLSRGDLPMLSPTASVLRELAGVRAPAEGLARRGAIRPVMPRLIRTPGGPTQGSAWRWWLVDAYSGEPLELLSNPPGTEHLGTRHLA